MKELGTATILGSTEVDSKPGSVKRIFVDSGRSTFDVKKKFTSACVLAVGSGYTPRLAVPYSKLDEMIGFAVKTGPAGPVSFVQLCVVELHGPT